METFKEYQKEALRTAGTVNDFAQYLTMGALGLCGEAGEVADLLKKTIFQQHELDREKIALELGDILWYINITAAALGMELEEIARMNIEKLRRRYPDGFEAKRSINRNNE